MDGTNYITIGYNFIQLVINSIGEMKKQGNKSTLITKGDLTETDFWAEYNEITKWNDNNIAIPLLFNFFHGSELILKGLIINCGGKLERNDHKLSNLLAKLKNCPSPPEKNVLEHFEKIIENNGFEDFFKENNTSIDSFYEIFKYPVFKGGNEIKFWMLRGGENVGLEKFHTIGDLASGIKAEIVKWKTSSTN